MKPYQMAAAFVLVGSTMAAIPAAAADVGVSVSVGQPGFYGRLDIGDFPQPQVIYRRPMLVQEVPDDRPPVYLRVPPGHAKHWRKHCHEYDACGERVYFVRDDWYQREYVPHYQERHRDRDDEHGNGRGNGRGDEHRVERGNGHDDGNHDHHDFGDDHRGNQGSSRR